jgi:hypothetical protein
VEEIVQLEVVKSESNLVMRSCFAHKAISDSSEGMAEPKTQPKGQQKQTNTEDKIRAKLWNRIFSPEEAKNSLNSGEKIGVKTIVDSF